MYSREIQKKEKRIKEIKMKKKLFKYFLGITILFVLLSGLVKGILTVGYVLVSKQLDANFLQLAGIITNVLTCALGILIYIWMYKRIQKKTEYPISLTDTIKNDWLRKREVCNSIGNSKLFFFSILAATVSLAVVSNIIIFFVRRKFGIATQINVITYLEYLVAPLIEEYIFRTMFFDYCEKNTINRFIMLNVIIFSLAHLVPMPYVIILGIMLAYTYKKYNSLILNTTLHFLFNLLGMIIMLILNSVM